jgi:hypothetical protein
VLLGRSQQLAYLLLIHYHTYILDTSFVVMLRSEQPLVVSKTFKICLVNFPCKFWIHLPDEMVITVMWLDKSLVELDTA